MKHIFEFIRKYIHAHDVQKIFLYKKFAKRVCVCTCTYNKFVCLVRNNEAWEITDKQQLIPKTRM